MQPGSEDKRLDKDYVKSQTLPDFGVASAEEAYSDKRFAATDLPKIAELSGQKAPYAEQQLAAKADILRKAQQPEYNGDLQNSLPTKLLRKQIGSRFSASRLEAYAACPFRFWRRRCGWRRRRRKRMICCSRGMPVIFCTRR